MENKTTTQQPNTKTNEIPDGTFFDGYCSSCDYSQYDKDRGDYWCTYHKKYVDGNEWHFCG